jgi:hypothetical protein
LSCIMKIIEVV